ncbi:hypothetical protein BKI52_27150 [marine bacterium AO1-C]|nr:hypothetical protein BKI52_27150 [marine bacterium AO1-C]
METIFENKFVTATFDQKQGLLIDIWHATTERMTNDECWKVLESWSHFPETYKPSYILIDSRQMLFVLTPDMHEWIATHITQPAIHFGLKKMATLLPTSTFEQVSMHQAVNEVAEERGLQTRIFDDETKAKNWLLSIEN